ncbi:Na+/H+ antiporter family protein [Persicirhabdus sediminis]|uniref:Na+/H+ antiporter family protein n=1 Tax=Persicirhabdus sediminis TaxID=454144 RepID=A0A8J7SPC1_9BACT|nr:Na+/H+ antiporter family protein [Persicirhabdus sediminis]MBK1792243.1 Na+/H+ antiporter family protein [Persicirhabdus sediminis]
MNAVIIAVLLMMGLSVLRVNVVIALMVSALIAGLVAGLGLSETIVTFNAGLGGGAEVALSYALLGAFAVALSHTGITDLLARGIIQRLGKEPDPQRLRRVSAGLLLVILLMAVCSQNLIPVHIAFIPILIPPLLHTMESLKMDRRKVACVITFGLVTTYMAVPLGFGLIFQEGLLLQNLLDSGFQPLIDEGKIDQLTVSDVANSMIIPAIGMFCGLMVALFFSYRKPRNYDVAKTVKMAPEHQELNPRRIIVALLAIIVALAVQLGTSSMSFGALTGFAILSIGGLNRDEISAQSAFTRGVHMMANIGFIMIAAKGFASVINETGQVPELVNSVQSIIGDNRALASLLMLCVGLVITMGIGSSFSTIPIITTIYVPLGLSFGFSIPAIIALVGTAAALGDAGSPASDSTLGPTSGLNADGQHDHIRDTVIPTFIHFNLPLIAFGWIASMVL